MLTLGLIACSNTCEHIYDNACDTTCNTCGTTRETSHTPSADDGNCLTEVKCSVCGKVAIPAEQNHTPENDDFDCSTDTKCVNCNFVIVEGVQHNFSADWTSDETGHYHICTNDGCKITDINDNWTFSTTMTRNFVSASSEYNGEEGSNLFDGSVSTKWCSDFNGAVEIVFEFGRSVKLQSYTLTTGGDTKDFYDRNWSRWTIYGSDKADGVWTEVHNIVDVEIPAKNSFETEPFVVNATEKYQYYKLVITDLYSIPIAEEIQQMAEMSFVVEMEVDKTHFGGESTCMQGKICKVCGYEYDTTQNPYNHSWDVIADNGEGGHTISCVCGEVNDFLYNTHHNVDADTGVCDLCDTFVAEAYVEYHDGTKVYVGDVRSALIDAQCAQEPAKLVLTKDIYLAEPLTIHTGTTTFDLNGKTIDSKIDEMGDPYIYCMIEVYGGELTIVDNIGNGIINDDITNEGGTLIIESGRIDGYVNTNGGETIVRGGEIGVLYTSDNKVIVEGGKFDKIANIDSEVRFADTIPEGYHFYDEEGNPVQIVGLDTEEYVLNELHNVTLGIATTHVPYDDEDCTTADTCKYCSKILVNAQPKHTGGTATCIHGKKCEVCGYEYDTILNLNNHNSCNAETGYCECGQFVAVAQVADIYYKTFEEAAEVWSNTEDAQLKLHQDVIHRAQVEPKNNGTIDLNGYTLLNTTDFLIVNAGVKVTIQGSGTLNANGKYAVIVYGGVLEVDGCDVVSMIKVYSGDESKSQDNFILKDGTVDIVYLYNYSKATMTGGIVVSFVDIDQYSIFTMENGIIESAKVRGEGSTFIMNGGQISFLVYAYAGETIINDGTLKAGVHSDGGNCTINGGMIQGQISNYQFKGTIAITGGTIDMEKNLFAGAIITGGTFTFDPSASVDTSKYQVIDNSNGTWSVVIK
jgi:hypothetical protein